MNENPKRTKIIEASKQVFDEVGIGAATMHIIADASGISRRTMYRYFESKEDLAYKVLLKYMNEWNRAQEDMYSQLEGLGVEKLESHLYALLDYMIENRHMIRFMGDFDYYFRDSFDYVAEEELGENLNRSFHGSDSIFREIIEIGLNDGSIRIKEDIDLLVATITNVLWMFGQGIALREEHIRMDSSVEPTEMFKCQIRLYIDSLRVE